MYALTQDLYPIEPSQIPQGHGEVGGDGHATEAVMPAPLCLTSLWQASRLFSCSAFPAHDATSCMSMGHTPYTSRWYSCSAFEFVEVIHLGLVYSDNVFYSRKFKSARSTPRPTSQNLEAKPGPRHPDARMPRRRDPCTPDARILRRPGKPSGTKAVGHSSNAPCAKPPRSSKGTSLYSVIVSITL